MEYIAHVKECKNGWKGHSLEGHLRKVGRRAAESARIFGASDWAMAAGLWHDLGKYRREFQGYIKSETGYDPEAHIEREGSGRVDHSTAGAVHAVEQSPSAGRMLAYLIAGHHAGLPDWAGSDTGGAALHNRLENARRKGYLKEALTAPIPKDILTIPAGLERFKIPGGHDGMHLWLRMLFSCLVDADFLDTEEFMNLAKSTSRGGHRSPDDLKASFDAWMERNLPAAGEEGDTPINHVRRTVLENCRAAGKDEPGIYTLTVPTGGGKTLSGMAFALEHAVAHGKDRIIIAVPYTSIIEQTAGVYKNVFGSDDVLEHHSNIEPDKENREDSRSRLASENWDVPIIVTTNVQLFESLFAARTSRCRKLHRIANSVIILDEAQMLPPGFLQPILDALRLLTDHYGATVVLSTATQPALGTKTDSFGATLRRGLDARREIIRDADALFESLERVRIRIPDDLNERWEWDDVAREIARHDRVLAIVNRRRDARELHALLPDGAIHLSGRMCAAHRLKVIGDIRDRLDGGGPLRVVSTQIVEAGVDLDFPVVYRALSGLDSIVQAAGRCNREGRLHRGEVVVFVPPEKSPPGLLRYGEQATKSVMRGRADKRISRSLHKEYFDQFFSQTDPDEKGILDRLTADARQCEIQFRSAARDFKLIRDGSVPVIVRYNPCGGVDVTEALVEELEKKGPAKEIMRKLQQRTVQVYDSELKSLKNVKAVREVYPGYWWLSGTDGYHDAVGLLSVDEMKRLEPEKLVY